MNFVKCDSCGKAFVPKTKTWNPELTQFINYDLCSDCNKKLQENWDEAFHKCGHDMNIFKQKKVEVIKAMCSASAPVAAKKKK